MVAKIRYLLQEFRVRLFTLSKPRISPLQLLGSRTEPSGDFLACFEYGDLNHRSQAQPFSK